MYIQNVPVYADTTRTCVSVHTGTFERTHWDVLNLHTGGMEEGGGHHQFCLPRLVHDLASWILHNFSLRIDREQHVPDSSNHSLYLTKLLSSSYPGETLEGTSREMVRFVFRSYE